MTHIDPIVATAAGTHHAPHDVLGVHVLGAESVVRVQRPLAASVTVTFPGGERHLTHDVDGLWQGVVPAEVTAYRVHTTYGDGTVWDAEDPYRFSPTVGELDLHLIGEGRHEELWRVLGSHAREHEGVPGVSFAVWAPHARAVRVVGAFNAWNGQLHAMRSMGGSGIWELFVPHLTPGTVYKYEINTTRGEWILKADPMAQEAELPPATASIVTSSDYEWGDDGWMTRRARTQPLQQPMSVYELHLGSWRGGHTYRSVAQPLIDYVTGLGFTHVEFMPLAEHPFGGSWGYQVSGYYAATKRFGSPDDLRYLIDQLHQAGIGVIFDWVPGHFPKDAFALGRFDGEALYEHPDPRRGEHKDWGTYIFDYGRPEVRGFLVANALFWLEEFHVDGLRVDAVASMLYLDYSRNEGEWEPNQFGGRENLEAIQFLQEANATAYRKYPGVAIIAEESTSYPGVTRPTEANGLGFGFKWNMGWMNDALQYVQRDPLYRAHHNSEITFSFVYAFHEHFVLPISHDEVVHGKGTLVTRMPGEHDRKLAGARGFLGYMWSHPGKKLLFMGQEFGQLSEWSESRELDWWIRDQPSHAGLSTLVAALNAAYTTTPALWQRDGEEASFLRLGEPHWNPNIVAFARFDADGRCLVSVTNFADTVIADIHLRLPGTGTWHEVLNTDGIEFGGAGVGNMGSVHADADGLATITVPALGTVWLQNV